MSERKHHDHGGHGEGSSSPQEHFSKNVGEVADAESDAKKIIVKAEEEKTELLSAARKKAAALVEKAAGEGEERREKIVEDEKKKIDSETKEIFDKARARAAECRKKPVKQLAAKLVGELVSDFV